MKTRGCTFAGGSRLLRDSGKLGLLLFLCLWSLWPAASALASGRDSSTRRIVAVGDVHGALDSFREILEEASVLGPGGKWVAEDTVLVQTGDFLDRGPRSRAVMDLLMAMEKSAGDHGSEVIVLLGNHEVMNLLGDLRYVAPEEYAEFAGEDSEKWRRKAFQQYARYRKKRSEKLGRLVSKLTPQEEASWFETHPPGFLERMEALEEGAYGRWLRSLPVAVRLEKTLFLHGGMHPDLAGLDLDDLNKRVAGEIRVFQRLKSYLVSRQVILPFFTLEEATAAVQEELGWVRSRVSEFPLASSQGREQEEHLEVLETFLQSAGWLIRHPSGPVWFRGYAQWTPEEGQLHLQKLEEAFGVHRFVAGHTTMLHGGIQVRFEGRVFLIDTGMVFAEAQGRPSALEIRGDRLRVYYPGQVEILKESP